MDDGEYVYLLYGEISDQTGTSEVIGVYSNASLVLEAEKLVTSRRSYIKVGKLDPPKPKGVR